MSARLPPIDECPARSLPPGAEWAWYVVAGVTYIAAGSAHKALLTWLVGPAWVVVTLWFGPVVFDAAAGAIDRAVHRLGHVRARPRATRRDTSGNWDEGGRRRRSRRRPP